MKLKALKYMRYAGKPVQVGDVFEANAQDVRILLALMRAEVYVEPPKARAVAAVFKPIPPYVDNTDKRMLVDAEPEEVPKRSYKRRDIRAE